MVWRVDLLENARRDLVRLDRASAQRIMRFLRERVATEEDPRRLGKPLVGRLAGYWRYRVGDFRLVCRIEDGRCLVLVVTLGHRRDERPVSEMLGGATVTKPQASPPKVCDGDETGYLPLNEAVNLLIGQPLGSRMNRENPGWPLWETALSAKQPWRDWTVRRCWRSDGIGNEVTLVHVGDFLQWATQRDLNPLERYRLWTPADLVAKRRHLEKKLDREGASPAEHQEYEEAIARTGNLLRRFAAVGLMPPESPQSPAREPTGTLAATAEAPIKKARKARAQNATQRRNDLKGFRDTLYRSGSNKKRDWAMRGGEIPYTKADFKAVFLHYHPQYNHPTGRPSDFELAELAIRFRKGTRSGKQAEIQDLIRDEMGRNKSD